MPFWAILLSSFEESVLTEPGVVIAKLVGRASATIVGLISYEDEFSDELPKLLVFDVSDSLFLSVPLASVLSFRIWSPR